MKNITFILFFLFCNLVQSQNSKFIEVDYEVYHQKSKMDTSRINEIYKLIINDQKSFYISEAKFKNDSIKNVMKENKQYSLGATGVPFLSMFETIIYENKNNKITTYKHILKNPIGYEEDAPKDWKLLDQTKKKGNQLLHSAEIEFGGRKWFAWYCTDYAFNEGPFKFKNLPGLIFEISDSDNIFNFQLARIRNTKNPFLKDYSMFKIVPKEKFKEAIKTGIEFPLPGLFEYMDVESQNELRKKSRERFKNMYYPQKEFE